MQRATQTWSHPDGLSIAQIMKNIPEDWNEQRRFFGFPER